MAHSKQSRTPDGQWFPSQSDHWGPWRPLQLTLPAPSAPSRSPLGHVISLLLTPTSCLQISLILYVCVCVCVCAQSWPTLCDPMKPARLPCPWAFSGKNTGVGCHFLLQGIFLAQGSNLSLLHLLHWQADFSLLNHGVCPSFIPLVLKSL